MDDICWAFASWQRAADERANFCRICWGPLNGCPGHVGFLELLGPPPSDQEVAAYRADLEVRRRGLDRRAAALNQAAVNCGYAGIDDLRSKTLPVDDD
jgi:hypothetical protein